MAFTRAELLAKAARRYAEHEGVRFQSLTELELTALRGIWAKRVQGMDEKTFDMSVLSLQDREILSRTLVDSEGVRLFGDEMADLDAIGAMDNVLFESLSNFARQHVGLTKLSQEVDRNEGKSEEATA